VTIEFATLDDLHRIVALIEPNGPQHEESHHEQHAEGAEHQHWS
jgi:hypothetical protein